MTALLYYTISSNLNENEIIKIDERTAKNREEIYSFIIKLHSNWKQKVKKFCLLVGFEFLIRQSLIPHLVSCRGCTSTQ